MAHSLTHTHTKPSVSPKRSRRLPEQWRTTAETNTVLCAVSTTTTIAASTCIFCCCCCRCYYHQCHCGYQYCDSFSFVLGMPKVATLQYVVTTVEFTRRDSEEKKTLPTGGSGQNDEAGAVNRSASVPHIASASAEAAGEALQIFAVPLRFSRP